VNNAALFLLLVWVHCLRQVLWQVLWLHRLQLQPLGLQELLRLVHSWTSRLPLALPQGQSGRGRISKVRKIKNLGELLWQQHYRRRPLNQKPALRCKEQAT
jgi:hypothetical protein